MTIRLSGAGFARVIVRDPGLVVVAEADDGGAAVELALAHQPHVAVVDLSMPRQRAPCASPLRTDPSSPSSELA